MLLGADILLNGSKQMRLWKVADLSKPDSAEKILRDSWRFLVRCCFFVCSNLLSCCLWNTLSIARNDPIISHSSSILETRLLKKKKIGNFQIIKHKRLDNHDNGIWNTQYISHLFIFTRIIGHIQGVLNQFLERPEHIAAELSF